MCSHSNVVMQLTIGMLLLEDAHALQDVTSGMPIMVEEAVVHRVGEDVPHDGDHLLPVVCRRLPEATLSTDARMRQCNQVHLLASLRCFRAQCGILQIFRRQHCTAHERSDVAGSEGAAASCRPQSLRAGLPGDARTLGCYWPGVHQGESEKKQNAANVYKQAEKLRAANANSAHLTNIHKAHLCFGNVSGLGHRTPIGRPSGAHRTPIGRPSDACDSQSNLVFIFRKYD